jgi:polyisoprenoid-binding protein YceI
MFANKLLPALLIAAAASPALAAPQTYLLDPDHTFPSLEFPHMGISWWRGKFNTTKGTVTLDRAAKAGTVEVEVDAKSIDFGHDKMNEHALAADWLDTANHPVLRYTGKLVFKGDAPVAVDGQLTLKGITRPLRLTLNSFKCIEHPFYKREACGADAEGELHRADFGMPKYADGEMGKVKLRIQVEGLKQ